MNANQYETEKAKLIAAANFEEALNDMRLAAQCKQGAAKRTAAETEAARISANEDLWGVIYADVKRQLPEWAQPFLVQHSDFESAAPSLSCALDLVLPFEAGKWQMDYRAARIRELADAVLYAADAPARDAELRAENAAKNAEHQRQADAFHEEHKASPLAMAPQIPICTPEERALLDALNAVIYNRTAYEQ